MFGSRYTFDRPETTRNPAKMNLVGHRDWRLSENYFEPLHKGNFVVIIIIINVIINIINTIIVIIPTTFPST